MLETITETIPLEAANSRRVSMGKDDFLKLLVAQLENQDPLDPLDNAQFTAQLAQFSSLEQLFDVNKNMEAFQSLQASQNDRQALNFLDRKIEAAGNDFVFSGGKHDLKFSINNGADEVYLGIYDSTGDLVKSEPLGDMSGGDHVYSWDGIDDNGNAVPVGRYSFDVAASGEDGPVKVSTFISGVVDGVSYSSGGPILSMGGIGISIKDIINIK